MMATIATEERPSLARNNRGFGRAGRDRLGEQRDLDLFAAALIGVAVGATVTYLFRQGPSGRRPVATGMAAAGRGARWAGRTAARGARRGAAMMEELPFDGIGEQVGEYLEAAKHVIEDTVTGELQDLRKAIRRQRKRLGL